MSFQYQDVSCHLEKIYNTWADLERTVYTISNNRLAIAHVGETFINTFQESLTGYLICLYLY